MQKATKKKMKSTCFVGTWRLEWQTGQAIFLQTCRCDTTGGMSPKPWEDEKQRHVPRNFNHISLAQFRITLTKSSRAVGTDSHLTP